CGEHNQIAAELRPPKTTQVRILSGAEQPPCRLRRRCKRARWRNLAQAKLTTALPQRILKALRLSHGENRGSSPLGSANEINSLIVSWPKREGSCGINTA